jgi:hypothetical protein
MDKKPCYVCVDECWDATIRPPPTRSICVVSRSFSGDFGGRCKIYPRAVGGGEGRGRGRDLRIGNG